MCLENYYKNDVILKLLLPNYLIVNKIIFNTKFRIVK